MGRSVRRATWAFGAGAVTSTILTRECSRRSWSIPRFSHRRESVCFPELGANALRSTGRRLRGGRADARVWALVPAARRSFRRHSQGRRRTPGQASRFSTNSPKLDKFLRAKPPGGQKQHDGDKVEGVQAQDRDIFPVDQPALKHIQKNAEIRVAGQHKI